LDIHLAYGTDQWQALVNIVINNKMQIMKKYVVGLGKDIQGWGSL